MSSVRFVLMCLLSCAAGDISEKLKQGQGLSAPPQLNFQGLQAPFQDDPRTNVKGGRPSGVKGGRPSGVKGGGGFRQLEAGAANPPQRIPIPFRNHDGDDDENNLDRLCNDAFHSFLCKPVGPRRRIDGKLRPGAQIPPGVLTGSSSNVQISKQVPLQSGGALLPTELDNDEGYRYPKPSNNVPSITAPGYSYPKPPYNYEIPNNQLAYPSQVSETVQKPSNEYLPSFVPSTQPPTISTPTPTTTTYRPPTPPAPPPFSNFGDFNSPSNQIPAQTNSQPVVLNQLYYQYPKPSNPISLPAASHSFPIINQPVTYAFPQTTFETTQMFPLIASTTNPSVNIFTYSTAKPYNPFFIPSPPVYQSPTIYSGFPTANELTTVNEAQPSYNEDGYIYPKPSNDNFVISPTVSTPSPNLPLNNEYLPPVGAPVPKESNIIFNSLPTVAPVSSSPAIPSSIATLSPSVPTSRYTTPFPFTFPLSTSTPRPTVAPTTFRTTTYRPITVISTTPSTTIRPFTFPTTPRPPPPPPSTLRPFIFQSTESPTTSRPPIKFNFASSNDVPFSAPQPRKPTNGYLPPPSQPIPSPANEFKNVLPFRQPPTPRPTLPPPSTPRPTLPPPSTPRPTLPPPPPPPREYLPQFEGSSTNLSPNIEGGSILGAEGDAPTPDIRPKSTERTHTLEELCRDAFHSFLCKPIDKPRRRIDGRLREGAKVPPHVMSLLAAASTSVNRKTRPNLAGGAVLPTQQNPQPNQYPLNPFGQTYQSTNVNPQLAPFPIPKQQSLFVLSASDSSSLAKKFSRPRENKTPMSPGQNVIENTVQKQTTKPQTVTVSTTTKPSTQPRTIRPTTVLITTTRPTTARSTTLKPLSFTTQRSIPVRTSASPKEVTLKSAATVHQSTLAVPASPSGSGGQLLASSATDQGYKYPKPPKPFGYPNASDTSNGYNYAKPEKPLTYPSTTAATGYDYPKPKKPFIFPTTQKPKLRPTPPGNRQFGQRLRPVQRTRKPAVGEERRLSQAQEQQQEQQSQFQEDPFGQNEVLDRENGLPPASQFEILKP